MPGKRRARRPIPPPDRPVSSATWRSWIVVALAAMTLRAWHLFAVQGMPFADLLMGDALAYDNWAQRIAAGDWLGTEVFYQAPLYPYLLGIVFAVFGHTLLIVRLVQIALGASSCVLLGLAASEWFGRRAGLVAGLILAVYPPSIFFATLLQKTVLDEFLLCALLLLIARAKPYLTPARGAQAGVVLGALVVTRENALLLLPILVIWAWMRGGRSLTAVAALLVGTAVVLAPVTARNFAIDGAIHITTAQFGPNLYIGNNPEATGLYGPLRPGHGTPEFERQDATELAERAVGHPLSAGRISAYWRDLAVQWALNHPGAWATLTLKKVLLTWHAVEAVDGEDIYTWAEYSLPLRLVVALNFGVLAPLGLLGILITRSRWRELWILYALVGGYTLSVAIFYVFARYRYPLVPPLMIFAGAFLGGAGNWWRTSSLRERGGAIAVTAVIVVASHWAVLTTADMRSAGHYNLGRALQQAQQVDDAIAQYRRAISERPDNASARANLGGLLSGRGAHGEAIDQLLEAVRLAPEMGSARVNLGIALAQAGRTQAAVEQFKAALAFDEADAKAHYNLGLAFASSGDLNGALVELTEAIRLQPVYADAQNNLGVVLSMMGRTGEALSHFSAASEAEPANQEFRANLERAKAAIRPR